MHFAYGWRSMVAKIADLTAHPKRIRPSGPDSETAD